MRPYVKYAMSSVAATMLDYGVTIGLTELAAVPYLLSSGTGLVAGGVLNYQINGHWVFSSAGADSRNRALAYSLCWIANLLVNTAGLYLLTDGLGIDYRLSKILTSTIVGSVLGFYAQNTFVFRNKEQAGLP